MSKLQSFESFNEENKDKWIQDSEKSEELIIELIQFLSMNEEFKDFSSISKETAKYFLEQFKNKNNDFITGHNPDDEKVIL